MMVLTATGACMWLQLNSSATDEEVEEALDFQLEELTVMAKKELELVDRMAEWRPWEVPEVRDGWWYILVLLVS